MTDPAKVVGFLDPIHGWDPSLGFVMGGAVLVNAIALRWIRAYRRDPWFDVKFHLPTRLHGGDSMSRDVSAIASAYARADQCRSEDAP